MEGEKQGEEGRQANEKNMNNSSSATSKIWSIFRSRPNNALRDRSKSIPATEIKVNQNPEITTEDAGTLNFTSGASPSCSALSALNTRNGILCFMGIASIGLASWLVSLLIARLRRPTHSSQAFNLIPFRDCTNISDNDQALFERCAICQQAFETGEQARSLACGHIYHDNCVNSWLKIRNTCPVCRHNLPPQPPVFVIVNSVDPSRRDGGTERIVNYES